ncbi:MAG: hypothetical protein KAS72_15470 [Phycisphaerales bacterium]|nr:hypothetical protein [Phycisphaerales bacterium]
MDSLFGILENDPELMIPILGIAFGCTVGIVAIIATNMASVRRTRAREQSRREIAAYIAEGSMTPEQGERLLEAGNARKDA